MQGACQANAITLNDEVLSVACQGHSIRLLPKEFRLFQFLFAHPNRTFSRDALLDAVWPMETPVDRTVDDHIYRLRKKLSAACFPVTLETVRGRGYRFVPGLATGKIHNLPPLETQQGLQTAVEHPLLRDPAYRQHIRELFRTYVLYGQGQGIHTMKTSPEVFGLEVDPRLNLHAHVMGGDFQYVLEAEALPMSEWLFWLLRLYRTVQFDYASTLYFMEQTVERCLLRTEHHLETLTFDLGRLYLFTKQIHRARSTISDSVASCNAMPEFLDGYLPLIQHYPENTISLDSPSPCRLC